jgi:hypothetical protein
MSEHETGELTLAMLSGTPVGGPGGMAVCDTCNRRLTDGHREHDPDDAEADTVYAYATRVRDTDRWSLRWVSCENCGPPGESDETTEPGEVVAKATLTFDARIDGFALADPELPSDAHHGITDDRRAAIHALGRDGLHRMAEILADRDAEEIAVEDGESQ